MLTFPGALFVPESFCFEVHPKFFFSSDQQTAITDRIQLSGADVRKVSNPASVPFSLADIESAVKANKPKMFFITHGESSTGVLQDLTGLGELCRK